MTRGGRTYILIAMPRHRFVKSIPRLKVNPYSPFDSGLSPKYFMWELYREPISSTDDERLYSMSLLGLLSKKGLLVEAYNSIEKELERRDSDDNDFHGIYPSVYDTGTTLYLYRDNLVRLKRNDDETFAVDCYHPVSRPCIIGDFASYLIKEKGESRVSVLISRNGGLAASKVTFAPPVITDLELNYGTGFNKTHDKIVEKLNARNGRLFIFSGTAGSGKSTYLKHLSSIIDREFIFVPVNMADKLGSPDFITLLMGKKEAVLILEDAEQAVQQRGTGGDDSAVATLLNLSDGILGSLLNVTIIVTFNADRSSLDRALLRKGRLAFDYDFGPLKIEDAQKLMKHLGKSDEVKAPMTLADIYGSGEDTGYVPPPPMRQMGFHTLIGTTRKDSSESGKTKEHEKS